MYICMIHMPLVDVKSKWAYGLTYNRACVGESIRQIKTRAKSEKRTAPPQQWLTRNKPMQQQQYNNKNNEIRVSTVNGKSISIQIVVYMHMYKMFVCSTFIWLYVRNKSLHGIAASHSPQPCAGSRKSERSRLDPNTGKSTLIHNVLQEF